MTRARLLAGCLMLVLALPAAAAPRDNRPTGMPPRPAAPPAATGPMAGPGAAPVSQAVTGLCQCIADHSKRNISCLGSAQECQSACATTVYSFVPFAPSCPVTAR